MFIKFLEELDEAPLAVLADVKSNRNQRLIVLRRAVNIFDAVDLIQNSFQRRSHKLFDFGRRVAWKLNVDVGQRDDDLRVLFAGRDPHRRQADQNREQDQNDRQIRLGNQRTNRVIKSWGSSAE